MAQVTQVRDLFGGAITAEFSKGFIDASDFRQVPDNQEVLVREDSNVSCILEVLQLARDEGADENLEQAVKFHFGSLAHDNSASDSKIDWIRLPSASSAEQDSGSTPKPVLLSGTQVIKKFGKESEPADLVRIGLALWRLEGKNVDLVLSFNEPLGSEADQGHASNGTVTEAFEATAASLQIRDWSLFA